MGYYEAPDELEEVLSGQSTVRFTREGVMEEEYVREWFKNNPRFEEIKVYLGAKVTEAGFVEVSGSPVHGIIEVATEDWPDYADFVD